MPELSVVVCSLNGATRIGRTLRALAAQSIAGAIEVLVVDDGSADATAAEAERLGVRVVRHGENRGLATARNTGVQSTSAPIVAFLDDDCEPPPAWAQRILRAFDEPDVVAAGGALEPVGESRFITRFLERHNPFVPLERDLARSEALPYRLWLYLRRQWSATAPAGRRPVLSLLGGNMAVRRAGLEACAGFDDRFTFGAEELDLCLRLARTGARLIFDPGMLVRHECDVTLHAALRRSLAYGRGSARLYRKWPTMRPTVFPFPFVVLALVCRSRGRPRAMLGAALLPQLMFPAGLRRALVARRLDGLGDPYVQLAQEAAGNLGFVSGLWAFRRLRPEPIDTSAVRSPRAASGLEHAGR